MTNAEGIEGIPEYFGEHILRNISQNVKLKESPKRSKNKRWTDFLTFIHDDIQVRNHLVHLLDIQSHRYAHYDNLYAIDESGERRCDLAQVQFVSRAISDVRYKCHGKSRQ